MTSQHSSSSQIEFLQFSVKSTVRITANKDGAALLDVASGCMYSLNHMGALVLQYLQGGSTPDQITKELVAKSGVNVGQVYSDVIAFVRNLQEHGLIYLRP